MKPDFKTDDAEHPVPISLRPTFEVISAALISGDFELRRTDSAVIEPVDASTATFFKESIESYGEALAPLDPRVWERSCYSYQSGYWAVIVDLTTETEPVSDLAIHARAYLDPSLRIEVWSVHVP